MTESDDKTLYVCMAVHRWTAYALTGDVIGAFDGMQNESVGFMPVFDDPDKLKSAYPNAEIMKVTRMGD